MKNKNTKLVIYIFLLFIISCSLFLLYIFETDEKKYDPSLYAEIYEEFELLEKIEDTTIPDVSSTSPNEPIKYTINARDDIYRVIASITIPKINVYYPIINETTDEYLKISPTKLCGANPNEVGNFCVVGHNFEDDTLFSNLDQLTNGDIVKIKNTSGKTEKYSVYDSYIVDNKDVSCLDQNTNGKTELTLITCTNKNNKMLIVKCEKI